ncbi:hypothetical protein RND71_023072 [Anisodus tanguticus]|uniref:Uncharacterized protein n=1 Tax=Anisodus tanguticus TaxID=243964 RepID=A0AAE1RU43_9SOLA|nr:hypothetical protein RND71_023072 [Anisodus tanguticus]
MILKTSSNEDTTNASNDVTLSILRSEKGVVPGLPQGHSESFLVPGPENALNTDVVLHFGRSHDESHNETLRQTLDATELSVYRTACTSALASKYLSRQDSNILLMIGAGTLTPHLTVRPNLNKVIVWNRTVDKATRVIDKLQSEGGFEGVTVFGGSCGIGRYSELCKNSRNGRRSDEEITVFKSVGSAVVDLLTAQLAYETIVS